MINGLELNSLRTYQLAQWILGSPKQTSTKGLLCLFLYILKTLPVMFLEIRDVTLSSLCLPPSVPTQSAWSFFLFFSFLSFFFFSRCRNFYFKREPGLWSAAQLPLCNTAFSWVTVFPSICTVLCFSGSSINFYWIEAKGLWALQGTHRECWCLWEWHNLHKVKVISSGSQPFGLM